MEFHRVERSSAGPCRRFEQAGGNYRCGVQVASGMVSPSRLPAHCQSRLVKVD